MKKSTYFSIILVLFFSLFSFVKADFTQSQEDKLNTTNIEIIEFKESYKREIYNVYEKNIKNLSEEELRNKLKNLENLIKKQRKKSNYELKNLNRLKLEVIYSIFEDELLFKLWIEKTSDLIFY